MICDLCNIALLGACSDYFMEILAPFSNWPFFGGEIWNIGDLLVPYWRPSVAIFWQEPSCQLNFLQLPTELIQDLSTWTDDDHPDSNWFFPLNKSANVKEVHVV